MLQTCTRCRSRRIKCDSRLPACQNCSKIDVECTFYDEALQEHIPRSYVQSLNERISELSSQVALQGSFVTRDLPQDASLYPVSTKRSETAYVLMPGTQQYMYLEHSPPSIIVMITCEALSQSHTALDLRDSLDEDSFSSLTSQTDRSLLTPSSIRYLLSRYNSCIRPEFDIVDNKILVQDGLGLRKLPLPDRFETLMVCAIAAAQESYRNPFWISIAQMCREWAAEDIDTALSSNDGSSLTAILLLLIYELSEPSRGSMWELMDLAKRTALQLGWHRTEHPVTQTSPTTDQVSDDVESKATKDRLLSVIRTADRTMSFTFNAPSTPGDWLPFPNAEENLVFQLYQDVQRNIYRPGQLYDTHGCPFVGYMADLMSSMDTYSLRQSTAINETWLLLLPTCVRHKQCVTCFQEADDSSTWGMRSLRQRLLQAAVTLIEHTHKTTRSGNGFVVPLVASSRAIAAGCTILLSLSKHWTSNRPQLKAISQCTEVLTYFMPHWRGGPGYLQVWNTILDLFDKHQVNFN